MNDRSAYRMHDITVESATPGRLTLLVIYSNGSRRNDDRLILPVRIEDEVKGLSASAVCYVRMTCPIGCTADILTPPAYSTLPRYLWVYERCRAAMLAVRAEDMESQIAASGMTWARAMAIFHGDVS
jgi:hypothetical protein